ncbi:MAG: hypothetical protein ABL894_14610 [Hyphomicrobium sp.]
MNLNALLDAADRLAGVTGKQPDLNNLVSGWLEKQLKAKSATLSSLELLVKSSGPKVFQTLVDSTSDTAARTLVKNLDPHNLAISSFNRQQIQAHALALVTGQLEPAPKTTKAKAHKAAGGGKKAGASSRARGDLLVDSKY